MLGEAEVGSSQCNAGDTRQALGLGAGLACLVLLLKYLGKATEPEQIKHRNDKGNDPFSTDDILLAGKWAE